ncbi:MAG: YtxH domain-containing protein [Nitrospinota bacterium]
MSENRGSTLLEVTLAFLLGGVVGAAVGLLFAPASGKETRDKIKDTSERVREKVVEGYDTVVDKTREGIGKVKDFIEEKKERVRSSYRGSETPPEGL